MGREIFPSTAKRCYINSAGNNKRLFTQMKKRLSKESQLPIQINEAKIMGQLQNNGYCCSFGLHYLGCIGKKFHTESNSTDHDKLLCYIKECRESTRYKSKDELKQFVAKIFDSSLVRMSRNNKTVMDYRLPLLNSASQIDETNNKVCRKGIAIAYGLSVKSLQAYSIAKRRKTLGSFLHSTRSYSESTIHNLNFAEVAAVFQQNVKDHSSQGMISKYCMHKILIYIGSLCDNNF
jgi:hypothetical protein